MKALNVLRRDQRGYTLAELLITVAILGLIMAAVLAVQMTSNTMFLRGESQAEAQQGARAAMLMEEDLRMAGYGCPDNGCPTPPPGPGNQQKITAASATSITFWADTLNASTTLSCNPVPVPPAMCVNVGATTLPVADASGIAVNDRIYINNGGTWETKTVTAKAGNDLTVAALTNAYPQGVQVGRPRQITYQFASTTLSKDAGDGNNLQPLATGITGTTVTTCDINAVPIAGAGGFTFCDTNDVVIAAGNLNANLANIRRIQIQTTTQSATSAAGPGTFTINTNVRPRNL
jgi:prepilin-type N-terminal cleavage/methylation domain-containing protein